MKKAYVVAWEFNGGGGFDWYHTEAAADKNFEAEKENCIYFAEDNWTAVRYTCEFAPDLSNEEITEAIIQNQEDLYDAATKRWNAKV